MGIRKNTLTEAFAYARERAQSLGSIQRIVECADGFRVSGEKRMNFFYPESYGWNVHPIY
jgi:hypothetical protein